MKTKKKPVDPLRTAELQPNPHRLLRTALIVAAYLLAFIIFDFITKQFQELPGIVAWYPPAGLTYTLLLVFGWRFGPAVTIALFISSLFIYRMPQPPYLLVLWAIIISMIYSAAAAFLRRRIHFDWQLRKFRDVTRFVFTTVLVSALLAVLSVSSSALSSTMPRSEVLDAIFHWWIGETVGVLSVTPFLLIFVMPSLKRFAEGQPVRLTARRSFPRPTLSVIGQAFSIVLILYWVFGTHVLDEFHPLFLIALPIIWIALQRGFKGVSVAILVLNSGVVLALWLFRFNLARLGELELLMIVICIVGLLMGAVVTERKQAEAELQENEEKYRTLVDEVNDGFYMTDEAGVFAFANPALARMYGVKSPKVLVGRKFSDFLASDRPVGLGEAYSSSMQTGRTPEVIQGKILRPDGTRAYIEIKPAMIVKEGKIVGTRGVVRDITERMRTEAERQALLEIMQGVVITESLLDLLELIRKSLAKVIYADNFFVVFKNKSTGLFEEVFAVDKYDAPMPPSKLERSMTSYVFRTGEPLLLTQAKFEKLVRRGEAELVGTNPAIWLGAPLKTASETIGVIVVQNYEDPNCYSERDKDFLASVGMQVSLAIVRKQAEDEIRQLNADLEKRVEERTLELREAQGQLVRQEKLAVLGKIAGSVSHELRNPLGVINNAVYYLKLIQSEAGDDIKRYHVMIEQEVHNAEQIISSLLDFVSIRPMVRERISIAALVERTLDRYPVPESINVTLELPPNLPLVFTDPRQVEQVLGSLVTNACQAMASPQAGSATSVASPGAGSATSVASPVGTIPPAGTLSPQTGSAIGMEVGGKLTISARRQKDLASAPPGADTADGGLMPPRLVAIAVKDNGVGIPPEYMSKLFEPLFSTKAKGIGLGLAVSRKLAEANGGRIEAQSEPGKGSTFTLYLPIDRQRKAAGKHQAEI